MGWFLLALVLAVSSGSLQSKHSGGWETRCAFWPKGQGFPLQVTPVVLRRPLVIRTRLLLRAGGFSSSQLKLGLVSNLRLACKGPSGE